MVRIFKTDRAARRVAETYNQLLERWGVPVSERDVETSWGTTHAIECGDAALPPLVLFHGVGDNSALMWVFNARALAARFHVYAIDTLGGPGKSRPNAQYGRGFDQVAWIDQTLDALGLERVRLAGVSNGAYMAQHYAIARSERVIRVACLSGGIAAGEAGSPLWAMLRVFLPEALFPTRSNTRKLIAKLSGDHSAAFTDDPLLMEHYYWLLRGFNTMAMGFHRVERFSDAEAGRLAGKSLFLCGESDPLGDRSRAEAQGEKYGVPFRFFPGAGYGLNHELPGEINAILIDFLGSEPTR